MMQALKISCGKESLDKVVMTEIIFRASGGFLEVCGFSISGFYLFFGGKWDIVYITHNALCGVDGWGVGCGGEGRAASCAAVEAGHRWQAGVDVRGGHRVWGVVL